MAGSVNQATGLPDFEDGPRIGNQSEARNGLQRVRTIPEINATIVPRGGVDLRAVFLGCKTRGSNFRKMQKNAAIMQKICSQNAKITFCSLKIDIISMIS